MSEPRDPPRLSPPLLALPRRPLALGAQPILMGILNCTPDSFSDGGLHLRVEDAVRAALAMVADGATIVDVGGESTRPGAARVSEAEELARVVPVIASLRARSEVVISCDTTKVAVARAALDAGADVINDVSAFTFEPAMAELVAARGCGCVLMHTRGTPATMMDDLRYGDVVAEVSEQLLLRAAHAMSAGVRADRIVLDPGIGFAKGLQDNLRLIRGCGRLGDGAFPILIGPSRKRFIGELTGVGAASERGAGTLGAVVAAMFHGAHILRVHDVRAAREAIVVATAIRDA